MKKLYLVLLLPVNIMAMDAVRCLFESGINWADQETFESAWTDQGKMQTLDHDFERHVPGIFAHRMQKIFEEHGDCTCFTTPHKDCDRLLKTADQQLIPVIKRETLRLRSLLGEQQPNAQGALIYKVLRRISIAAVKQLAGKYLTEDAIKTCLVSSVMNIPWPHLQAAEKRVLEEKIYPQLDETDVAGIKELVASIEGSQREIAHNDEIKD